jgi:hypothetical protein
VLQGRLGAPRPHADLPDDDARPLVDHIPLRPLQFVGRFFAATAAVEDVEIADRVSRPKSVLEALRLGDDVALACGGGRTHRNDLDRANAGQTPQ